MIIKSISKKDSSACFELDKITINLWTHQQWINELENESVRASAIFFDEIIIGISISQQTIDEVELRYLSIHPDFKRRGLGKKLIENLIIQSKVDKVKRIFLEVSSNNKIALNFYKLLGFKTIGFRKKYYRDGSDGLLKEKLL